MKHKYNRIALAATALLVLITAIGYPILAISNLPFDDIASSYAKQEITDLYDKKIMTGTTERSFAPTASITRAEFITVLDRLLKLEPVASPITAFTDVSKQAWYYGWIQAAVQLGLADGVSATSFAPSKSVTRQEAAVLMARALKMSNQASGSKLVFGDERLIADWANSSIAAMNKLGLMKGDNGGQFRPTDPISRQETAVIIHRVLQNEKWAAVLAAKPKESIKLGWQYGQTTEQYQQNILKSNVNTLSPRWYFASETGDISDNTVPSLITWAKANNKKVWAMVGNRSDLEATHKLLSNPTARNKAISQLVTYAKNYKLDGLNIDFENVAPKDRSAFTTFITDLSKQLKVLKVTLSIDVSPDLGTDWTDAFDFAALGKQADYMVLMGYDEHWGSASGAGPNASLGFDEAALSKLIKAVPSQKVILAMPFYNRDWNLKKDGSVESSAFISLDEQNKLIDQYNIKPVWNEKLGLYTASYVKSGVRHQVWLEEGRSLTAKYKLAVDKKLAGLAYWYVGGESSDIWTSFKNADRFLGYSFS